MPLEQLRLAVPGLAGIAGLVLFPTLGAWGRLLLEYLEWHRPGLTRPKPISGLSIIRAIATTTALAFFILTLFRAAGELRDVQAEAPVVVPSIQGLIVGITFWAVYAIVISALRADARRRLGEKRNSSFLR